MATTSVAKKYNLRGLSSKQPTTKCSIKKKTDKIMQQQQCQ